DTVTVMAMDPPVADAGPDATHRTGNQATLDGSGSSEAGGNSLTYAWVFISRPAGSSAGLSGADTATPQFPVDATGAYVLELTVSNAVASDTARVTVTGTDNPG